MAVYPALAGARRFRACDRVKVEYLLAAFRERCLRPWNAALSGLQAACLKCALAILLSALLTSPAPARQQENSPVSSLPPATAELAMEAARRRELEQAIQRRDYRRAETILVEEISRAQTARQTAALLVMAGGIFFLDGQYLNSAIAYQKAEAIRPLDERSRFTLAMAHIKLNRRDWARTELERLAAERPKNPLYLYWLARLDYDAQEYQRAIARFEKVIELDPGMMRAFDGLGLCYDYLGRFDEAISSYRRAVKLNRQQAQPSAWPHVNLAISLMAVGRLTEAEQQLREALGYDAKLPQAHYQLGQVLEKQGKYEEAIRSLKQAAALDPTFPEPHYTLGRIYQRRGDTAQAKKSIELFQQLKKASRKPVPAGVQTSTRSAKQR
jgi:tetratricopeptide (TPR) repeat protein